MCLLMADEMSECQLLNGLGSKPAEQPVATVLAAMTELPTLQRNALFKIFDRPHFTPEEVAALGYRRLQQAEGIGTKGLSAIAAWLKAHGHQLPLPTPADGASPVISKRTRRTIEMAVRLLRAHGYEVQQQTRSDVPGKGNE